MAGGIDNDDEARRIRTAITEADLAILELVNRRVELVQQLRAHKVAHGYPMVDPGREDWLVNHLREANRGPLSDEGVRTLAERVISLTKTEVYETQS